MLVSPIFINKCLVLLFHRFLGLFVIEVKGWVAPQKHQIFVLRDAWQNSTLVYPLGRLIIFLGYVRYHFFSGRPSFAVLTWLKMVALDTELEFGWRFDHLGVALLIQLSWLDILEESQGLAETETDDQIGDDSLNCYECWCQSWLSRCPIIYNDQNWNCYADS